MNFERGAVEETPEKASGGVGPAIGQDLQDRQSGWRGRWRPRLSAGAGSGIAAAAVERRQAFDIDVNEAGLGYRSQRQGRGLFRGSGERKAMPLKAAVDGAARQPRVDAAPRRLGDVVERQGEAAAQLDNQGFFPWRQAGVEAMWAGRAMATSWRARQRATVRLWMPSSRASAALLAWLFWM